MVKRNELSFQKKIEMLNTLTGRSVCNETNYTVQPLFLLAARSLCISNRHIPPRPVSGKRLSMLCFTVCLLNYTLVEEVYFVLTEEVYTMP